eukprot:gb/GECG01015849.1/.p1 GENE.gb/GECG01015849.1/~~gb/GECG01015849.1/.p1  ORF type:complete len:469 (+),score=50.64 gb/GECG01015849.1/:1-1407(+)
MDFLQRNNLWSLPPDQEPEDRRLQPRWGRWSYASLTTLTGLSSVLVFNSLCFRPLMWRPWNHFLAMTVYGILGYRVGRVCEDAHGWMQRERDAYSRMPSWVRVRRAEQNGGVSEDGIEQTKRIQQLRRSILLDDVKKFQVQRASHERAVAAGEASPQTFRSSLMPHSLPTISSKDFAEFLASLVEQENLKELSRTRGPTEPAKVLYTLRGFSDQISDFFDRLHEVAMPVYPHTPEKWEFSKALSRDPLAGHAMLLSTLMLVKIEEARAAENEPESQVYALVNAMDTVLSRFITKGTQTQGRPTLLLKSVFPDTADDQPQTQASNHGTWDALLEKSHEYLQCVHRRLKATAEGRSETFDDQASHDSLNPTDVDPSTARKLMICVEFIMAAMEAGKYGHEFNETQWLRKRLETEPLSIDEQNQLIKVIELRKEAARQIYLSNIHHTAPRTLDNKILVSVMAEYGYEVNQE